MKTIITKITLIICLFAVFSCKKSDTTNNGPVNNHQTTNCQVSSYKGNGGDNFFYYNGKYQVIASTSYDSTGKTAQDSMTFQYNSAGQMTGMNNYNPNSSIAQNSATFVYNASGALIQYNQFIGSISTVNTYDDYTSDSKGNITIDSNYSFTTGSPVLNQVSVYTYDGNGNVTTGKTYSPSGILGGTETLTYDNYTSYLNGLPLAFRIIYNSGDLSTCSNYNNITSLTLTGISQSGNITLNLSYTYNSTGLPITGTFKTSGQPTQSINLNYLCH